MATLVHGSVITGGSVKVLLPVLSKHMTIDHILGNLLAKMQKHLQKVR